MLFLLLFFPAPDINGWEKIYNHAADNEVRLSLTVDGSKSIEIVLLDGEEEYSIAFVGPVIITNEATYWVNLTPVLRELKKPPSKSAKIKVKWQNTYLPYKDLEIELR